MISFDQQKDLFKLSDAFETGLSDQTKRISTIVKSEGFKRKPKEKICISYRQINYEDFTRKIWNLDRTIQLAALMMILKLHF